MNRLKALYRSWAIPCAGTSVYSPRHRAGWLAKITEVGVRRRAEFCYQELDALQALHRAIRRDLLQESRNIAQPSCCVKFLRSVPCELL